MQTYDLIKLFKDMGLEQYIPSHTERSLIAAHIIANDVLNAETCENISDMHPVDEFICSSCGVIIRDCSRYEVDEDSGDESCLEFKYQYCPRCGKRIVYEENPGNE